MTEQLNRLPIDPDPGNIRFFNQLVSDSGGKFILFGVFGLGRDNCGDKVFTHYRSATPDLIESMKMAAVESRAKGEPFVVAAGIDIDKTAEAGELRYDPRHLSLWEECKGGLATLVKGLIQKGNDNV